MRLPRGYRVVGQRLQEGSAILELEVAWWRRWLLIAEALWLRRPTVLPHR